MILYYYTGHEFFRNILQEKRLKLSRYGRFGTLNDPFEQAAFDISNKKLRSRHKQLADKFAQKLGLICLSETWRSPAMWAHYTDNHEGACLEFELKFDQIFKIKYQTKKLPPKLSPKTFSERINNNIIKQFGGTKSEDWSYEKEHRMHFQLDDELVVKDDGHYFIPFHEKEEHAFVLKRVFIGYRCSKGISNIMDDVKGYPHKVDVVQTRPAFSKFEIVKQKEKTFWNMEEGQKGKENSLPAVQAVFGNYGL